jgi:hypothetical protein
MLPIGDGVYPLPSEREKAAKTLEWAEASEYRHYARARMLDDNPNLGEAFGLLSVTTWIVTFERLKIHGNDGVKEPVPQQHLALARELRGAQES